MAQNKNQNNCPNPLEQVGEDFIKRGHANLLTRLTDRKALGQKQGSGKEIQENMICREWANSVAEEFGMNIENIRHNQCDPPDCFAERCGETIGIEVTELVKGEILSRIAQQNIISYSRAKKLRNEYWSDEDLYCKLKELILSKNKKCVEIDALIIATDEPDLTPERLEKFVRSNHFPQVEYIKEAYLLRGYWPGYREYWPVFQIFK